MLIYIVKFLLKYCFLYLLIIINILFTILYDYKEFINFIQFNMNCY